MSTSNRLYDLLELPATATPAEIRAAYHRIALRCHPDKAGPAGAGHFVEVRHAYDVLSDPQKRRIYDRYGERGLDMANSAVGSVALSAFHLKTLLVVISSMTFVWVSMALLFLIFLACKVDSIGAISHWSWPQVFGPLFALAGIVSLGLLCFSPAVISGVKAAAQAEHDEQQQQDGSGGGSVIAQAAIRLTLLYVGGLSFTAFVVLLAVGLHKEEDASNSGIQKTHLAVTWRLYCIPLYLLSIVHLLTALLGSKLQELRVRLARFGLPEVSNAWLVMFAALEILTGACTVTFSVLIACRVDRVITCNWFVVGIPLFVSSLASFLQRVLEVHAKSGALGCCGVVGTLFQHVIGLGLPVATAVMIFSLIEQGGPSTANLTLAQALSPMFAIVGGLVLFSCCGCCVTCCMPAEMFDPTGTDAAEQHHEEGRRENDGDDEVPQGEEEAGNKREEPSSTEPIGPVHAGDID